MKTPKVLMLIMAGGSGGRLGLLTDQRAKPVLPIGGTFRMIDIPLSNARNSGFSDVWILEQFKPHSLNDHLANGRPWDLDRTLGGLRVLPPFEGGGREGFADGNADALFRQTSLIREFNPDLVLVASADHLYRLDYRDVIATHQRESAALTMVTTKVTSDASEHGVVESDGGRIAAFEYKPERPTSDLVSAEVFLFDAQVLCDSLDQLARRPEGLQDYGDQLIPYLMDREVVADHRLAGYWRDLGTPERYLQAHLDLLDGDGLEFDDPDWPILTGSTHRLPAFVAAGAQVADSLVSPGARVGGQVERSVIGPGAVVEEDAVVFNSVLLGGSRVCEGAVVKNTVLDVGAHVGADAGLQGDEIKLVGADGRVERP